MSLPGTVVWDNMVHYNEKQPHQLVPTETPSTTRYPHVNLNICPYCMGKHDPIIKTATMENNHTGNSNSTHVNLAINTFSSLKMLPGSPF